MNSVLGFRSYALMCCVRLLKVDPSTQQLKMRQFSQSQEEGSTFSVTGGREAENECPFVGESVSEV